MPKEFLPLNRKEEKIEKYKERIDEVEKMVLDTKAVIKETLEIREHYRAVFIKQDQKTERLLIDSYQTVDLINRCGHNKSSVYELKDVASDLYDEVQRLRKFIKLILK